LCVSERVCICVCKCVSVCEYILAYIYIYLYTHITCSEKVSNSFSVPMLRAVCRKRAVCCSCVAVYSGLLQFYFRCRCFALFADTLHHTTTHYNMQQYTATHCNTLQHTATHCNTLYRAIQFRCRCLALLGAGVLYVCLANMHIILSYMTYKHTHRKRMRQ